MPKIDKPNSNREQSKVVSEHQRGYKALKKEESTKKKQGGNEKQR